MKKNMDRSYFKTIRLRSGLTQSDVAFLMGCKHHNLISMLEKRAREPSLKFSIAYCIIFGIRLRDLVPGHICRTRKVIKCQSRKLLAQLKTLPTSAIVEARIMMVERIIKKLKN